MYISLALLLLVGCYHLSMVKAVRSGSRSAVPRSRRSTATLGRSTTSDYQKVKAFLGVRAVSVVLDLTFAEKEPAGSSGRMRPHS